MKRYGVLYFTCESCFRSKPAVTRMAKWNVNTHWMFPPETKRQVLYLLLIGKYSPLVRKISQDVWKIVIKHYVGQVNQRPKAPYCADCMKKIYQMPVCLSCHASGKVPATVTPDYTYSADWKQIPLICKTCSVRKLKFARTFS